MELFYASHILLSISTWSFISSIMRGVGLYLMSADASYKDSRRCVLTWEVVTKTWASFSLSVFFAPFNSCTTVPKSCLLSLGFVPSKFPFLRKKARPPKPCVPKQLVKTSSATPRVFNSVLSLGTSIQFLACMGMWDMKAELGGNTTAHEPLF